MRSKVLDSSGCSVRVIISVVVILLFFPLGVLEIYVEDGPLSNYNVGDEIEFLFTIKEDLPVTGYVAAEMNCGDEVNIIFKEFISFVDKNSLNFSIISLAESDSECFIAVTFLEEEWASNAFVISSDLEVAVVMNSKVFLPGELLVVSGSVTKFNGGDFNYFIDFSFGESYSDKIAFNETNFAFNFSFPQDVPSGIYPIVIGFVDKNLLGDVINEGVFLDEVEVLSKVTSIGIEVVEEVKPPYELPISVTLFDQSGKEMLGENVIIKIYDTHNDIVLDTLVVSGGSVSFSFPSDSEIGAWKINAVYADLEAVQSVYVSENKEVSINFDNDSSAIVVTNIGNIDYEGVMMLRLESDEGVSDIPINVDLSMGESSYSSLDSEEGEYNISVGEYEFKNVYITGAAISSALLPGSRSIFSVFWIVMALLFVLLFYFGYKYKISLGGGTVRRGSSDNAVGNDRMHEIQEDRAVVKSDRVILKRQRKTSAGGKKMNEEMKTKGGAQVMKDEKAMLKDESKHEKMRVHDERRMRNREEKMRMKDEKRMKRDDEMRMHDERRMRNREDKMRMKDEKKKMKDERRMMRGGDKRDWTRGLERVRNTVGSFLKRKSDVSSESDLRGERVYGLLFRNSDYKDLSEIFRKYGLKSYNVGGVRFCLLKSSKNLENKLVGLSKLIITKTKAQNLFLHSMSLQNSLKFKDFFVSVSRILLDDGGLVISEDIYRTLGKKQDFVFWRSFEVGDSVLKLYKMKL